MEVITKMADNWGWVINPSKNGAHPLQLGAMPFTFSED